MWGGGVKMEMETFVYIREAKQRSLFLQGRYTLGEDREYTETRLTSHWYDV
jgi:hypothetical protein